MKVREGAEVDGWLVVYDLLDNHEPPRDLPDNLFEEKEDAEDYAEGLVYEEEIDEILENYELDPAIPR